MSHNEIQRALQNTRRIRHHGGGAAKWHLLDGGGIEHRMQKPGADGNRGGLIQRAGDFGVIVVSLLHSEQ